MNIFNTFMYHLNTEKTDSLIKLKFTKIKKIIIGYNNTSKTNKTLKIIYYQNLEGSYKN